MSIVLFFFVLYLPFVNHISTPQTHTHTLTHTDTLSHTPFLFPKFLNLSFFLAVFLIKIFYTYFFFNFFCCNKVHNTRSFFLYSSHKQYFKFAEYRLQLALRRILFLMYIEYKCNFFFY